MIWSCSTDKSNAFNGFMTFNKCRSHVLRFKNCLCFNPSFCDILVKSEGMKKCFGFIVVIHINSFLKSNLIN